MLTFKKYSSIENASTRDYLQKIKIELSPALEWVVQEKVHGSNTSFLCDGTEVRFAKRTSLLDDNDQFYEFQPLLQVYIPRVLSLFSRIKSLYPGVESVAVFGEMFGGRYSHPDVAPKPGITLIQKGVHYTPGHEFYAFDIYILKNGEGRYLSVDEANSLFEAEGFFYAATLFRGPLAKCLEYPNAFQSKIPQWLGLPDIDDNICEGVVIRPVEPQYLRNGSRVMIKNKNERFAEKKSAKQRNKLFDTPAPCCSEALQQLQTEIDAYITINRLNNVVSHIGEVTLPKDFGKLSGLFAKDILDDFIKEHGESYLALDKSEQKALNRKLTKMAGSFLEKAIDNNMFTSD